MKNSVVIAFCLVVSVVMGAPTNTPTSVKRPDTDLDTQGFIKVVRGLLPIIQDSISLFSAPGGTNTLPAAAPGFNSAGTFWKSGRAAGSVGDVGNVDGPDSPFVPNFVIPGYTIPGNSFTPSVNIPSIHIQ